MHYGVGYICIMSLMITQVAKLRLHQGSIYCLEKGENDLTFFSAGSEGLVAKWNIQDVKNPVAVAKVDGHIFSLLFLAHKNHLLIGTMSGALHIIDLKLKKEIHYIAFHEQSIFDIKEHDGKIFVCSKDGSLSIWNAETYQFYKLITMSQQALRIIVFNPLEEEASIGSSDNKIYILDTRLLQITGSLEGPDNSVFSLCYSRGSDLIAGSRDAQLYIYDSATFSLKSQIKAHLYTINHIVSLPEFGLLATASRDKTIRLWNAETLELEKSLDKEKYDGHINSVNKLLWLSSDQFLISCSDDRSVIVWKIER